MDEIEEAIETKEVSLGDNTKIRISLKTITNEKFIDVRKWQKYPNLDHFVPTKKGLMISLKDWKLVIPIILELIKDYTQEELAKAA